MNEVDRARSANMARIGSRNTTPELTVRSALHRMGYRFRLHSSRLPGKPDIVLPRLRTVIFVHGCFWHRHPGCKFAYNPKTRSEFWQAKFVGNVARDARVLGVLRDMGWKVHVIWECETKDSDVLRALLRHCLSSSESDL
ncbi:very short patch repair endonuclease [Rhodopseudomonas palustris]|uniref:Very short patch repair endonuclease n=1 Tax=Rhodopseudomonas palustris (strain DX-1) TaxID=652103 RepID=E6VEP9_RHOPX|nr:very short patch repair endonuclease [Rhodopseudomonas palustris]